LRQIFVTFRYREKLSTAGAGMGIITLEPVDNWGQPVDNLGITGDNLGITGAKCEELLQFV
jgi:hypothetical protein